MKNIYLKIPLTEPEISNLVLATVTGTEGSTPQKPGSSALFDHNGLIAGTVGGGVLEGKVQSMAKESLLSGKPCIILFRLDNTVSDGEDALCGGNISVLIDSLLSEHIPAFEALRRSAEARIPGILITNISEPGENGIVIKRYWMTESARDMVPLELLPYIEPELSNLILSSGSYDFRKVKLPEKDKEPSGLLFLEPVIPPPRLIIAGAGHIGKALSQIGSMLDFEVTVIDDRPEFANPENIPFANNIITGDIGKAIMGIDKRADTYIVIVTRGHQDDGNALKACIGSDAAYIGMIGSKTKIELMRREFIGNGLATQEQWNRIYAPVGVDIKSKTVEEIAVSIAAQLVKIKNNK